MSCLKSVSLVILLMLIASFGFVAYAETYKIPCKKSFFDAQKVEQVFTNMVNSASRKYRGSGVVIDVYRDYSDSARDIEDITNIYWSTEGLIMLIYLIIASVASKREKKKNA